MLRSTMTMPRFRLHPLLLSLVGTLVLNTADSCSGEEPVLLHSLTTGNASSPLAFSEDESLLAWVHSENWPQERSVVIWNIASHEEVARFEPSEHPGVDRVDRPQGYGIFFIPGDAEQLALPKKRGLTLWDFRSGDTRDIHFFDYKSGTGILAVSPDGACVVAQTSARGEDSKVEVRSLRNQKPPIELSIVGWTLQLVFRGESQLLVVKRRYLRRPKSFAIYLEEWNVDSGERQQEWGPFPITGTRTRHFGHIKDHGYVRLSPDGRLLVTTFGERFLVIDVESGRHATFGPHLSMYSHVPRHRLPFGVSSGTLFRSFAFDPDGYSVATAAFGSPNVWFWPIAGRGSAELCSQPEMDSVVAVQYSRSERLLAVTGTRGQLDLREGKIHLWRLLAYRNER